ncbi:Uncharacterised protein [Streptococcus pneumoniae]|nr:Uncharacterised protein [Streptococcus pneumoniae]VSD48541.1 Uncharacterised protein [Streptococcus pneumoniae]
MNKTTEMIVFRSRKTGEFLNSYKDRSSLAFAADFCSLEYCLKLPRKNTKTTKRLTRLLLQLLTVKLSQLKRNTN